MWNQGITNNLVYGIKYEGYRIFSHCREEYHDVNERNHLEASNIAII